MGGDFNVQALSFRRQLVTSTRIMLKSPHASSLLVVGTLCRQTTIEKGSPPTHGTYYGPLCRSILGCQGHPSILRFVVPALSFCTIGADIGGMHPRIMNNTRYVRGRHRRHLGLTSHGEIVRLSWSAKGLASTLPLPYPKEVCRIRAHSRHLRISLATKPGHFPHLHRGGPQLWSNPWSRGFEKVTIA